MPQITAIYEFTVSEKSSKDVESTSIQEGKEVKTITSEPVETPVKVFFKKPSRRDIEEGELFYARKMNEFVNKHGLMTRAMLANKYRDSGGIISEETVKQLYQIAKRSEEIKDETAAIKLSKKISAKRKVRLEELENEYIGLQKDIIELEQYKNALMENTADEKAVNEYLRWLALNMTFVQTEDDDLPAPYFKGASYEEKLNDYYDKEDSDNDIYAQVSGPIGKASAIWYMFRENDPIKFKELIEKSGE